MSYAAAMPERHRASSRRECQLLLAMACLLLGSISSPASTGRPVRFLGVQGYYALLSSTNTSDIINNNNIAGRATITVGPDVKAVSVSHCQPWFWQGATSTRRSTERGRIKATMCSAVMVCLLLGSISSPASTGQRVRFLGVQVYYALLSSTNTSDIINNNNIDGRATITVGPDVKAVSVSHCQPWFWQGASLDEAIASVRREPQNEEVLGSAMDGDGVFVVGLDIKPGVYRTAGPVSGRSGYYALLSSTNTSDIINNNNIDGRATITVGPDVKAVSVSHCQPWFWQGASLDEAITRSARESG